MKIVKVRLHPVSLQLKQPFVSSHETLTTRELTVVDLEDETGMHGYGELEAFSRPFYTSETQVTARWIMTEVLADLVTGCEFDQPEELYRRMDPVKDNQLAKAAVDSAVWDLYAKRQDQPLAQVLATSAQTTWQPDVPVGISVGIQSLAQTCQSVRQAQAANYGRIKLKVHGNADLQRIAAVRKAFPTTKLCVDANGSLTPAAALATEIDALGLTMLEDPFARNAQQATANLQSQLQTDLCYDEPIESVADAVRAIRAGECRIISMKSSVLGGLTPALQLVAAHRTEDFSLWCGGMVEGGVGRATNLALASLAEFAFPGDLSATDRYFAHDYAQPEFQLRAGQLQVPRFSGNGVTPQF